MNLTIILLLAIRPFTASTPPCGIDKPGGAQCFFFAYPCPTVAIGVRHKVDSVYRKGKKLNPGVWWIEKTRESGQDGAVVTQVLIRVNKTNDEPDEIKVVFSK